MSTFTTFKSHVEALLNRMLQSDAPVLLADTDRDKIWETYLNAFPEEQRQEHNCNCCKSFIRQVGGAIQFGTEGTKTVWDGHESLPHPFNEVAEAMKEYVLSCPVEGFFETVEDKVSSDKNFSQKHQVVFNHFHLATPRTFQADNCGRDNAARKVNREVIKRSLDEISIDSLKTVLELIAQNSLYRGAEFKDKVDKFLAFKKAYDKKTASEKKASLWNEAYNLRTAFMIKNTVIGTLLTDLTEGKDLEDAVRSYESKVAPTNYKRPTALVTPAMVENAKKKLEELGAVSALKRRRLDARDLGPHNSLFVHRPKKATKDIFETISTASQIVDKKKFNRVEQVTMEKFVNDILPSCESVELLVENKHLNNFVTLTGPDDSTAEPLFYWNNSFGWSYTGGVADSIKERVKAAGGKVDGWGRISLAWGSHDDLDLHLIHRTRNCHIYYYNKSDSYLNAKLDVDMNAGGGQSKTPVENIHINKPLPIGAYVIHVNQFAKRDEDNGYTLQFEAGDFKFEHASDTSPKDRTSHAFSFVVTKDGIKMDGGEQKVSSKIKWNIQTNKWTKVKTITKSPNFWEADVGGVNRGNLHWFFILEGCISDENTRPFYNEFLTPKLAEHRKVMEVLASKMEVADAEGAELSGVGFSETIRNSVFLQITGTFSRIIEVLI